MKDIKESGFSLLSSIVAVGIFGIIAVAMMRINSSTLETMANARRGGDREALRFMLLEATDCRASLPAGTCTSGEHVDLFRLDRNGDPVKFIEGEGQRFGSVVVRSICNNDGNGLTIKYAYMRRDAVVTCNTADCFLTNPLTKKKFTFASSDEPRNLLFREGVDLCSYRSGGVITTDCYFKEGSCDLGTSPNCSGGPFPNHFFEFSCEDDEIFIDRTCGSDEDAFQFIDHNTFRCKAPVSDNPKGSGTGWYYWRPVINAWGTCCKVR